MSFTSDEIALEALMAKEGVDKYHAQVHRLREQGRESLTAPGRRLIQAGVPALAESLTAWIEKHPNTPGAELMAHLDPYLVAIVSLQTCLDSAVRGTVRSTIAFKIGQALEHEAMFKQMRVEHKPLFDRLIRRRGPKWKKTALAKKWRDRGVFDYTEPASDGASQAGLVCVELTIENAGIFDWREVWERVRGKLVMTKRVRLTPETERWIMESHEAHEALTPAFLPMVEPPADWAPHQPGGYRTHLARRKPLVVVQRRRHVGTLADADMPDVYQAINALQATPFEVNPDILEAAEYLWRQGDPVFPDTDPPNLEAMEIRAATRARQLWDQEQGKRVAISRTLGIARRMQARPLYYPHHLDFRGRAYPVPPFLTVQGFDLAKGLLRFRRACEVTDGEALERWQAYGADLFGRKGTRTELAEWTDGNTGQLRELVADPLDAGWWRDAGDPWQFLAWAVEYGTWLDDRHHPVRVPLHMDGSNNGLQIFSLLARDEGLAGWTNVLPAPAPQDIYQHVADRTWARVASSPDPLAKDWLRFLPGGLPRAATKRPVMTLPYSVTKHSSHKYLREWLLDLQRERDEFPWGFSTFKPVTFLHGILWDEIQQVCTRAVECMEWLQHVAGRLREAGAPFRWVAPSGFPVTMEYPKVRRRKIQAVIATAQKWVHWAGPTDETDGKRQKAGSAPNFVHSLDASVMMQTVCRAMERGVEDFAMVHDSYGVPVSDSPIVARALREVYAETFSRDLLREVYDEGILVCPLDEPPALGDLDPTAVLDSTYFF